MARNIALTLTVDGVQQTITSIGQLEEALKKAKTQLQGLEIGSEEFKKLQTQIRQADSALKNLQEQTEGKKLEETVGRYAKIGSAITGSFAAAQAAISLFGSESEEVTKAATQAQNLLTLALTGREVAEASVAGATLIADLATKAQTTSTLAADSATKKFYATLAANPYTALVIGISLLVTALITLGGKTDEAKKKQKEFNDKLLEDTAKEKTELNGLITVFNNTALSIDTRKAALDKLRSKFPAYFKDLKDEELLSGKVKINTDLLTEAIVKQARARALSERVGQNVKTQLELEDKLLIATRNRVNAENDLLFTQKNIVSAGQGAGTALATASNAVSAARSKEVEITNQLNEVNQKIKRDGDAINKINLETDKVIGGATDKTDKNTEAKEKNIQATREQIALQKQFEQLLNNEIESLEKQVEVFKKISEGQAIKIGEPEIIKQLEQIKSAIDGLLPQSLEDKFKAIGLQVNFVNGRFEVTKNTLEVLSDTFGEFVEQSREELTKLALAGDSDIFEKQANQLLNAASELFQVGKITKEAFGAFDVIIQQYKDFNKLITQLPDNVRKVFTKDILTDYLETTKQIAVATGDIQYEEVDGQIKKITNTTVNLRNEQIKLNELLLKVEKELQQGYTDTFKLKKDFSETDFKNTIDSLVKQKKLTEEQGLDLKDKYSEFKGDLTKLTQELAKAQVDALNQTVQNIVAEENEIRSFLFKIQEDRKKGLEQQAEALPRVFLNNLDLLFKFTSQSGQIVIDETQSTEEQILSLKEQFDKKNIDLTKLTEEEILKIIEFYTGKQIQAQQSADKTRQEKYQKFLDGLEDFQSVVTQLSQTTADFYSFQLEMLDKQNESIQSKIIGDTEEANKKRLENEKIYQSKRKELEKNQARTSLGISLVQAVANTAQAVTRALAEGGVAGPILAGIFGALGAVQVGIIGAQISAIEKYRRGGFVKMSNGGFMVNGPSHEFGGVKYAGGGIELEGGEAVINRKSSLNYQGILSSINMAGGGKPLVNNFDDSRIVEAIAKQRNEPIRAYVVESDITNKQQITRRLEQLAQF